MLNINPLKAKIGKITIIKIKLESLIDSGVPSHEQLGRDNKVVASMVGITEMSRNESCEVMNEQK